MPEPITDFHQLLVDWKRRYAETYGREFDPRGGHAPAPELRGYSPKMPRQTASFCLDADDWERFKRVCADRRVNQSAAVRYLIHEFLRKNA